MCHEIKQEMVRVCNNQTTVKYICDLVVLLSIYLSRTVAKDYALAKSLVTENVTCICFK